jgi:hypothetical protein
MADANDAMSSEHFSPYRSDGKLYGFVCVVTGATQPVGKAIVTELAGESTPNLNHIEELRLIPNSPRRGLYLCL